MKKHLKIILPAVCLAFLLACSLSEKSSQQVTTMAEAQAHSKNYKVLGTKGSGMQPTYGFQNYAANTIESVRNALQQLDGAEIDLQLSSDGTLWVYEKQQIKDCRSRVLDFSTINDTELGLASKCWHKSRLVTLDSMLYTLRGDLSEDKTIAFDLRFLDNTNAIEVLGGKQNFATRLQKKLKQNFSDKPHRVLLEVANDSLYPILKQQSNYPVYHQQSAVKNLDEKRGFVFPISALKENPIKKGQIKDFQISGIKTIEDAFFAIGQGADYLQTENVPLGRFLSQADNNKLHDSSYYQNDVEHVEARQESINLATIKLEDWNNDFLLNFQLDSISDGKTAFLVYRGKNEDGQELMWEGRAVVSEISYWRLINPEALKEKGIESLSIQLFNQNKLNFQLKNIELKVLSYNTKTS